MDIAIADLIFAAGIALAAGFLTGVSGFGSGLMIAVFAVPMFGAKAVVPLMAVVATISSASRLYFYWRALEPRPVFLIMATAFPFSVLGAYLYYLMDEVVVGLLLAFYILLSIPIRYLMKRFEFRLGDKGLVTAGAAIGFVGSITIGIGILLVPVLMGSGLFGAALLAARAGISFGMSVTKMGVFTLSELLTPTLFLSGIVIGLMTIPGIALASWVVHRTAVRIHTVAIEILLVAFGLWFLWLYGSQLI